MARSKSLVQVLGSTLEGGGQLVRLALSLSSLTRIPIRITNIRGGRPGGGGLKGQHLTAVELLAQATQAQVEGAAKGSKTLDFRPTHVPRNTKGASDASQWYSEVHLGGGRRIKQITVDQNSPGSITCIFQAVLPFLLFSSDSGQEPTTTQLKISGGTNCSFSPSYEYLTQVLLPTLERIGVPPISASLNERGWTHGRPSVGSVEFLITPFKPGAVFPAFTLQDRGDIRTFRLSVLAPASVRSRILTRVSHGLRIPFPDCDIEIVCNEDSLHPKRLYLLVVAESANGHLLGSDCLYDEKIKDANHAADRLVDRVVKEVMSEVLHDERCVDRYMQDQLVVFQTLAAGQSQVNIGEDGKRSATLHTRTARWVADQILGTQSEEDGDFEGVGFAAGEDYSRRPQSSTLDLKTHIDNLHFDSS